MTWTVPLSMYGRSSHQPRTGRTNLGHAADFALHHRRNLADQGSRQHSRCVEHRHHDIFDGHAVADVLIGVLLVMAVQAGGLPAVLAVALTLFALILIPIEITQEIALSVVVELPSVWATFQPG